MFTLALAFALELERADADQLAAGREQSGTAPIGMGGIGEDRFIQKILPVACELLLGDDLACNRAGASAGPGHHHLVPDLCAAGGPERQWIEIDTAKRLDQPEAADEIESQRVAFHH